ncbi:MAG: hypothetical protein AAF721_30635, partial [Myxococcota bacterium]
DEPASTPPPEAAPPEAPPPVVPPPTGDRSPQPAEVAPWHRDPVGGALLGTGLATLAVGVGLYVGALAERDRGRDAPNTDAFRRSVQRTRSFEISGITVMAVGGPLVVGAIIRYSLYAAKQRRGGPTHPTLGFRF